MLQGMANPFSSIETSINAATLGALCNATMTWGAAAVPVVFDAVYADPSGMVNSRPQARCLSSLVSAMSVDASVTINAVAYTVKAIEPDGAGQTTLVLRRA